MPPLASRRFDALGETTSGGDFVEIQILVRRAQRAWRAGLPMVISALLMMAANAAIAASWNLHTLIEPPALPDVDPADHMAFGAAVSVGSTPWLVVGAPFADCANPSGRGTIADTGRIFIYRRVSGEWQYHQSFCALSPVQSARYGSAVDVSESWMIVGAPGAAEGMNGVVEMFYLNSNTQQWSRQLITAGVTDGFLGQSVAIDRGLAVAGEPGYSGKRGRLRTWKLTGSSIAAQAHYAPAGLVAGDRYGRRVAVQSNGCELPFCTSFTDSAVSFGGSRLYVAKRAWNGWQLSQTIDPPSGAAFAWPGALDVSHYQVIATLNVMAASTQIGCPVGPAVRVYYRSGGNFNSIGDACQPPSDELATFGYAVSADRGTDAFHVASPDRYALGSSPAPQPASVSTFAGHPVIRYLDSVEELNLAPPGPAPSIYNDSFGASISAFSSYMAVGAPWSHVYFATPGIGYVAIYWNCC